MTEAVRIERLCKAYPSFRLENVSFAVEQGSIMGFIGRNGAGKTTTMKSMLNMVHPDSGAITFFGLSMAEKEREIKQRIGYAAGGVDFYRRRKIREIVAVAKTFYSNWDEAQYRGYMQRFSLTEDKRLAELSEGMKVKFNLVLALSHHAELLLLDEPTSGLDPVSRDELLEVFLGLAAQGVSILFSTHITSDLEKCVDGITYIKGGRIVASDSAAGFVGRYRLLTDTQHLNEPQKRALLGVSHSKKGATALIETADAGLFPGRALTVPELETIMVHLEKETCA